jgi:hypothetical protein
LADGQNLLEHLRPVRSSGVTFPERLTDGIASRPGDPWTSQLTTTFRSADASVVYDLGAERGLSAIWLQGDHNDAYEIALSSDGATFVPAWTASPVPSSGL